MTPAELLDPQKRQGLRNVLGYRGTLSEAEQRTLLDTIDGLAEAVGDAQLRIGIWRRHASGLEHRLRE